MGSYDDDPQSIFNEFIPASAGTVDCKYEGGIMYIQKDLDTKNEQTFLYVKYFDGTTKWFVGPVGDDDSSPNPDALIASLNNSTVQSIWNFHTHPYGAKATMGMKLSSPSIGDFSVAFSQKQQFKTKKIIPMVIAEDAVWEYPLTKGEVFKTEVNSVKAEHDKFFANSPKAEAFFMKQWGARNPSYFSTAGIYSAEQWAKAVLESQYYASIGKFGPIEKKNLDKFSHVVSKGKFWKLNILGSEIMYAKNIFELEKFKADLITLADEVGISLKVQEKPHLFCSIPTSLR